MRKSRFSEEQIIGILKEVESGLKVTEACRKYGMSAMTFYSWRKKYHGLTVAEAKRMKALEDENRRLKVLVANLSLDNTMLKDVLSKKLVAPAARREVVGYMQEVFEVSQRRACRTADLERSTCRYETKPDQQADLKAKLTQLAEIRPRFGQERLHVLLRREGYVVNHKRTERLYRELGLALRLRKRPKRGSVVRIPANLPTAPNQRWSMDFDSDELVNGHRIKCLTVVDDFTREVPAIAVARSITGQTVADVLSQIGDERTLP